MGQDSIGKYLSMARRAHASLLDQKLKPYNISHGQLFLLIILYKQEKVYQKTLCNEYNLNKAAVGRSMQKLKEKGLIAKQPDPEDKRRKILCLTDKAVDLKPKIFTVLEEVEEQARTNLTEEEIATFLRLIKKICNNLGVELETE